MKFKNVRFSTSLLASGLLGLTLAAGCNRAAEQHPDDKDAVVNGLKSSNMSGIDVSQDRDKGVITIKGNVPTDDQKTQAEQIAKQNAAGYVIANEILVTPPGAEHQAKEVASANDDAIESSYKAMIKGHKALSDQHIDYKSKNGTLTLTGSVRTVRERDQAVQLAKSVPNVQQVVSELKVENVTKPSL